MATCTNWYPEKTERAVWYEGDVGAFGLYHPPALTGPLLYFSVRRDDGSMLRVLLDSDETQDIAELLWREHHTCLSPR